MVWRKPSIPGWQEVADWPFPARLLSCVVLAAVVGVPGHLFFRSGQQLALERLVQEERELAQRLDQGRTARDRWQQMEEQSDRLHAALVEATGPLPPEEGVAELMVGISRSALGAGLVIDLFQPGEEVRHGFHAERDIRIRLSGSYSQLEAFIARLGEMAGPGGVTLDDITLLPVGRPVAGGESLLSLEGMLRIHRAPGMEQMTLPQGFPRQGGQE